jgi:hypothetical protein
MNLVILCCIDANLYNMSVMDVELLKRFVFRQATREEIPAITSYYNSVRASVDPALQESTDWAPFDLKRIRQTVETGKLHLLLLKDTAVLVGAAILSHEAPHFWRNLDIPSNLSLSMYSLFFT